ncbi:hypothetical protein RR46_12844 [Papilio xuthus]|uniref:TATA box-binding protein-associated factor RNA polymerase I subunit B n=1 Tax=Papilio xuthus TaxID=66420 RepID=A0A194PLR7_PAPXU|nr:hypothetical protein RR46_12844 [Papilio xuthus]
MNDIPCSVCGSTDLNLVDGFYYCVECGTQDVNVRETIVGESFFADGTKLLATGKKFSIMIKEGIQMSAEWYKWHAYNFILYGLTEELIKLGAKQSIKTKVLWIWTRYMKKFQEKDEEEKENLETQSKIEDNTTKRRKRSKSPDSLNGTTSSDSDDDNNNIPAKYIKNIAIITKGLLLAILYLALNFDKCSIQLSHLFRYIKEDRLSLFKCTKFVPKEIETNLIPCWKNFCQCKCDYKSNTILHYALTCVKVLDLGYPILPDFNKMINTYIKELCLPNDFKNLVYSLLLYQPYKFKMNKITIKKMVRIPDYETIAMSYILLALKMCFGLDGAYEIQTSNVINQINNKENHWKSYKIGMYTESTERLFSFDEWTRFLQFRKILICQYYLPMARHYNLEVNDFILMEHLGERKKRHIKLRDEVTMDILNKIPYQNNMNVIPKSEFPPSLTPMSTYTNIILNIVPNDEIRLLLSEDFTQYNLKYATENIKLINLNENIITGINELNIKIQSDLDRNIDVKRSDNTMVFVRNCENKNWLKTKQPTLEHINDKTIDSKVFESSINETDVKIEDIKQEDIKFEYFEEEQEGINIFDDNFDFLLKDDKSITDEQPNLNMEELNHSMGQLNTFDESELNIDENNFNKEAIINELIALALKKYKIKLPKDYVPRPRKRKAEKTEITESLPKKRRIRTVDIKQKINNMIGSYYSHIETDILTKVTERVKDAFERQENNLDVTNEHLTNNVSDDLSHEQTNITDHLVNTGNIEENNSIDNLNSTNIEQNEDLDDNLNKDSDFDAKTHDISQLYIKLNDIEVDESLVIDKDPVIDEIILNKIEKSTKELDNLDEPVTALRKNKLSLCLSDDSCDELKQHEDNKDYFPHLINDSTQINKFNYWLRFYKNDCITRYSHAYLKFDSELKEQFPASFCFVLNECANIIGCSTYHLYKDMQNLEKMIFGKLKKIHR